MFLGCEQFQISFGFDEENIKLMDLVTAIDLAKNNEKIEGIHFEKWII